jgi:hypothetical protein
MGFIVADFVASANIRQLYRQPSPITALVEFGRSFGRQRMTARGGFRSGRFRASTRGYRTFGSRPGLAERRTAAFGSWHARADIHVRAA